MRGVETTNQFGNLTQLWKMAMKIVDLPINNGDCPVRYVKLPEGIIPLIIPGNDDMSCSYQPCCIIIQIIQMDDLASTTRQ